MITLYIIFYGYFDDVIVHQMYSYINDKLHIINNIRLPLCDMHC